MTRAQFYPIVVALAALTACSSIPHHEHKSYVFPKKHVFIGDVKRPYDKLGLVRTKVNYPTLDASYEEKDLCKNYFNKAAIDLYRRARQQGADAVIDMKSVTFLEDGRVETYPTAECSDDGEEGQILAQGVAVKWKREPDQNPKIGEALPASRLPRPTDDADVTAPVGDLPGGGSDDESETNGVLKPSRDAPPSLPRDSGAVGDPTRSVGE